MSEDHPVTLEVRALAALNLEGLRAEWRRRYGPPPLLRSQDLLRRNLAWRIQADAFGGLDADLRRRALQRSEPRIPVPVGARLVREWQGRRHEVERTEDGFRYDGVVFKSLSQVARKITGVRWNGPRFFGLRQEAQG